MCSRSFEDSVIPSPVMQTMSTFTPVERALLQRVLTALWSCGTSEPIRCFSITKVMAHPYHVLWRGENTICIRFLMQYWIQIHNYCAENQSFLDGKEKNTYILFQKEEELVQSEINVNRRLWLPWLCLPLWMGD